MLIVDEALRGSSFGRGPRTPLPLRRRPGGTERREIRKEGVTKTNCDRAVTPGAYGRVHRSEPTKTGGGARPSRRAGVGGEEGGEPVEGAPSRGSNPGTSEEAAARRRTGVHRRECGGSLATHREPGGAGAEAPGKEERAGPAPRGSGQPQPRKSEGGVTSRRGLETDYRDRGALPCRAPDRERPESRPRRERRPPPRRGRRMRRAAADRRSEERPKGEKRERAARTTSVYPRGAPRRWSGRTREHRLTGRTGPRRGAVRRPIRAGPRRGRGARGRGRRAAQRQKMHTVGVRLPKLPASRRGRSHRPLSTKRRCG